MHGRYFRSQLEFRRWLAANHASERELLVGFYKRDAAKAGITYPQSVDEALCWGWIDGVRRMVDEQRYTVRFSPRKAKSYWSNVNLKRYADLEAAGRVKNPGREAHERRDADRKPAYSFEQASVDETALRRFPRANSFFQLQAPWYRRTAMHWVTSAKREDTRQRRLRVLAECCERGVAVPPMKGISLRPK